MLEDCIASMLKMERHQYFTLCFFSLDTEIGNCLIHKPLSLSLTHTSDEKELKCLVKYKKK